MDFQDIIKFRPNLKINVKRILFVLGVRLHTEKCLLSLKTPKLLFNSKWTSIFTTLSELFKFILMIYLLTLIWEWIILIIYAWFFKILVICGRILRDKWSGFRSRGRRSLRESYLLSWSKPHSCWNSLYSCQEAILIYHPCGSTVETLRTPSPDFSRGSYQSILVRPN